MKIKNLLFTAIVSIAFISSVQAQNVNIPDANFKAALVANASINTNMDAEIQTSEAATFTGAINVSWGNITDLTGIEAFVALDSLDCSFNYVCFGYPGEPGYYCINLVNLNISANIALTYLKCSDNVLTSLNVLANTALTSLDCSGNPITSLDVSANTALTYLNCYSNQLTSLDVSTCSTLAFLYCFDNNLTSLNVNNGYNINMFDFQGMDGENYPAFLAYNNPNLSCIEVDNVAWSNANWANNIDATASFSLNCSGAGISDINSNAPIFYPNPTTGTISFSEPANITLSDLSGKLLLEEKNTNQLDISTLPAGMYFLHFGENNNQIVKVIKE
jgi:hypothetical protein